MALIETEEAAYRLAKAIVSDLILYSEEKINRGMAEDNLFELLAEEIQEGRSLFHRRVDEKLHTNRFYDRALVDVLIRSKAHLPSVLW